VTPEPLDLPLREPLETAPWTHHEAHDVLVRVETDGPGRGVVPGR
jgi:hypothetical protein